MAIIALLSWWLAASTEPGSDGRGKQSILHLQFSHDDTRGSDFVLQLRLGGLRALRQPRTTDLPGQTLQV
jgi:hypothetical protein